MMRCVFSDWWSTSHCPYDLWLVFCALCFCLLMLALTIYFAGKKYDKENGS